MAALLMPSPVYLCKQESEFSQAEPAKLRAALLHICRMQTMLQSP